MTFLAFPNFLASISSNLGIILPPVATAMSSISVPETHLTAGKSAYKSKWLASSSNPHWHITMLAPESLHLLTISLKYYCSASYNFLKSSTLVMLMLCLVLGLGGSKGQVKMQILASSISFLMLG